MYGNSFTALPRTTLTPLVFCSALLLCGTADAGSLAIGYGQTEQDISLGDSQLALDPGGLSVLLSLDINDDWSINLDYESLDDEGRLEHLQPGDGQRPPRQRVTNSELEINAWGLSSSYLLDNWSFGASYYQSDNDVDHVLQSTQRLLQTERADAKTLGLSAGYSWQPGQWFFGVNGGVQYSDWQSTINRVERDTDSLATASRESGESWFVDISLSASRYWPLADEQGIMAGGLLAWTANVSDDSAIVLHNGGRRTPPRAALSRAGASSRTTASVSSFSEEDDYGQVVLFVGYDFNDHWTLDLDTTFALNSDNSGNAWSLSLGYHF